MEKIEKNVWVFIVFRAIITLLFGIYFIASPVASLATMALLFAVLSIFDGVVNLISGFFGRKSNDTWWANVAGGIASILFGLFVMFAPIATASILLFIIGIWAITIGVVGLIGSVFSGKPFVEGLFGVFASVIAVFYGVYFLVADIQDGVTTLAKFIGAFSVMFAVVLFLAAIELKRMTDKM